VFSNSAGSQFFHIVDRGAFDAVGVGPIEFRAMLGKKFNDRNDLVLFEFSQSRIPLDEKVRRIDLPSMPPA
jgi:hypothetical protein